MQLGKHEYCAAYRMHFIFSTPKEADNIFVWPTGSTMLHRKSAQWLVQAPGISNLCSIVYVTHKDLKFTNNIERLNIINCIIHPSAKVCWLSGGVKVFMQVVTNYYIPYCYAIFTPLWNVLLNNVIGLQLYLTAIVWLFKLLLVLWRNK